MDTSEIANKKRREQSVLQFIGGKRPAEIATELGIAVSSVYRYIQKTRRDLMAKGTHHFDAQLSALLEEQLDTLINQTALLGDPEFLRSVSAEKLQAIAVTYGICTDKAYILLSAAQRYQERQNPAGALCELADTAPLPAGDESDDHENAGSAAA